MHTDWLLSLSTVCICNLLLSQWVVKLLSKFLMAAKIKNLSCKNVSFGGCYIEKGIAYYISLISFIDLSTLIACSSVFLVC